MTHLRLLAVILLCVSSFSIYAQDASNEISYASCLRFISEKTLEVGEPIVIKDKIIYWEKSDTLYVFNEKIRSLLIPNYINLQDHRLVFQNCTFKLHFNWSNFFGEKQKATFEHISFEHCTFEGRLVLSEINMSGPVRFTSCIFKDDLYLDMRAKKNDWGGFILEGCEFANAEIGLRSEEPVTAKIHNCLIRDSAQLVLWLKNARRLEFSENKFSKASIRVTAENLDMVKIFDNRLYDFVFQQTKIGSEFDFMRNVIAHKLLLHETYFAPDPVNDIDWNSLDSLKIGHLSSQYPNKIFYVVMKDGVGRLTDFNISRDTPSVHFNTGEHDEDISNDQAFAELMGMYSMFLNLYKNKYDIESYNRCLITMKDLQSKRLYQLYKNNKNFNTYFRWKLSRLMRFYVLHGTDPARAIVISIYIILFFGIFFFFFPSDWDVTSKKKLIQNFRDFIEKNEKGYVKPFLILSSGFAVSLINAITLSLNAFVTLGFGNIPTHGLARYVCILEGFLGWFLLSIFTVALINQVL